MDMFEKVTRKAKDVGETVFDSAKNIGTSLYNSTKDQGELAGLNVQKSAIEKKLTEYYAQIGKRYVEYIDSCSAGEPFEIEDILEEMEPKRTKLVEVKAAIAEKESDIRKNVQEKAKKKAQEDFDAEKAKLDKALQMEILSEEEYEEKLAVIQAKFENYDALRKIDLQFEMGIISAEEREEKIKAILA